MTENPARRMPFFYGYAIIPLAILAHVGSSPGQTFAVAAFTPHLQESLSLSSSQLAAAYMLGTFLAAFPLSLVGPLSDRWGLRWTLAAVAAGLGLACLFMGYVAGFATLLVGFLLLRLLGQGALTLLSGNLVSMWFRRRLGAVNSLMFAGGAAAFALVPLLMLESIDAYGWRTTYILMALVILLGLVPLFAIFVRCRPEDMGQLPDGLIPGRHFAPASAHPSDVPSDAASGFDAFNEPEFTLQQAVSHRAYWILSSGMAIWAMVGTGIVFYALQIYDQYGIPADRSKLLFTTFSASMLVSQVVGGILADRWKMHRLLAIGFCLLAAGTCLVPCTTSEFHVQFFALLFGCGQGLLIAVTATMWVRYYGRKNLGKIRGLAWCTTVAGSGVGPFLLGLSQDYLGSFTPGLWFFACLLLPLGPLCLLASPPSLPAGTPDPASDRLSAVSLPSPEPAWQEPVALKA